MSSGRDGRRMVLALLALLAAATAEAALVVEDVEEGRDSVNESLVFDSLDQPHVAFGVDHAWYAVKRAGNWSIETADPGPSVGSGAALVLDSAGEPRLVYTGSLWSPAGILYARRSAGTWSQEAPLLDVAPSYNGDSIAIDGSDRVFALASDTSGQLSVARTTGTGWAIDLIDGPGHEAGAVAAAGTTAVVAYSSWSGGIKVATWNGAGWTTETITPVPLTRAVKIALDSLQRPVVAWTEDGTGALRLARWNAGSWSQELVKINSEGYELNLALDSLDRPYLTWFDLSRGQLEMAHWDGTTWNFSSITGADEVDTAGGLAVDSLGNPGVVYVDLATRELVLRRWDGSAWSREVIEAHRGGSARSIRVAPNGTAWAVYSTYRPDELRLAERSAGGWVSAAVPGTRAPLFGYPKWSDDFELDAAGLPMLLLRTQSQSLELARWNRTDWTFETVVTTGAWQQSSLAIDQAGHPAICWLDSGTNMLRLGRFDGSAWAFSDIADLGAFGGGECDIEIDSADRPVVAFMRTGFLRELALARFDGLAWSIELVDSDPNIDMGYTVDLALDALDRPALAYELYGFSPSPYESRVAGWDGTAWMRDVLWRSFDFVHSYVTAAGWDSTGEPRFVSHDPGSGDLEIVTRNGGSWRRELVQPGLSVAWVVPGALTLDPGGNPTLLYSDRDSFAVRAALVPPPPVVIRRGVSVATLAPVATAPLPWIDPEPVLDPGFPALLMYQVDGVARIAAARSGRSVALASY